MYGEWIHIAYVSDVEWRRLWTWHGRELGCLYELLFCFYSKYRIYDVNRSTVYWRLEFATKKFLMAYTLDIELVEGRGQYVGVVLKIDGVHHIMSYTFG